MRPISSEGSEEATVCEPRRGACIFRDSGLVFVDEQTVAAAKRQILFAPPTKRSISLCEAQGDSGRIDQLKRAKFLFRQLTALGPNVPQPWEQELTSIANAGLQDMLERFMRGALKRSKMPASLAIDANGSCALQTCQDFSGTQASFGFV